MFGRVRERDDGVYMSQRLVGACDNNKSRRHHSKKGFKKETGHRALFHKKKETMQAPTSRPVTPSSLVDISPKKGLFFKKRDRTQGSFSQKKRDDAGTHESSCDTNKSRRHQSKQRALFQKNRPVTGLFFKTERDDAGTHKSSCDTIKSRRHQVLMSTT